MNFSSLRLRAQSFFIAHKLTVILGVVLVLILGSFVFFLSSRLNATPAETELINIDLPFDPNGAFALLIPRRDGHALELDLRRVGSYEAFAYQITYADETNTERAAGDLNTWVKVEKGKSDYRQEILFGTCSKGNTMDPLHCVFDNGVQNGTLTLRLRQGNKAYKMEMLWHLQQPDVDLGKIISVDNHFKYDVKDGAKESTRQTLTITAYTMVNDLSGIPKLPEGKTVVGKVYALNIPSAKTFLPGAVTIEQADPPPADSQIAQYIEKDNAWKMLDTKINGSVLTTSAPQEGIFAVFANATTK